MKKEAIGWVDALRVLACFMVVLAHSCDAFVAQFDNDRTSFLTGVFTGSLMRPCVPIFAMLTGVLLFPVRSSMADFYKKRIGRLVIPVVFWSLALPLLFYAYFTFGPGTASPSIDLSQFTWEAQCAKLYTFLFNFNYDTTPLWYLYMLVGLYLILPVVSVWLERASKADVKLFLKVWSISLFVPYVKLFAPALGYTGNFGNMGLWGVCDWNAFGAFHYVSGFLGYMVLAHYLVKHPLQWSWSKILMVFVPMFVTGYAITSLGFVAIQHYYPSDYAYLEIVWLFAGINVFMMTLPLFVVVQRLNAKPSAALAGWSSLAFGIYLCHFVVVQVFYDFFASFGLPYWAWILLVAVCTFTVSAAITWLLKQTAITRKVIL